MILPVRKRERERDKDREEKREKGRRDDATHLRLRHVHALTPPRTSVHTFFLLLITATFSNK